MVSRNHETPPEFTYKCLMYTCAFLIGQFPSCLQILKEIPDPSTGAGVGKEDKRKWDTMILLKVAQTYYKTLKA